MIIQTIVILLAVAIALITLGKRRTHSGRAWKKIALVLLAVTMVIAVLVPETTNAIARFVGVGRGADLVLYATVLAFIFYALNNYLYQQDQQDAFYRLARRVALIDANERYEIRSKR